MVTFYFGCTRRNRNYFSTLQNIRSIKPDKHKCLLTQINPLEVRNWKIMLILLLCSVLYFARDRLVRNREIGKCRAALDQELFNRRKLTFSGGRFDHGRRLWQSGNVFGDAAIRRITENCITKESK